MIVYKFGGALARSKRGLEALVRILDEAQKREAIRARRAATGQSGIVLVASAIGHTTRYLARAAELAEEGRLKEAEDVLSRTVAQHEQLAATLRLDREAALFERFESISNQTASLLEGIAIVRELSLRTRDAVLAQGELLATALIEALLKDRGIPVRFIDARNIIVTDETFGHAVPNIKETGARTERAILPALRRSEVALVPGFIGATRDGITTTMGSESSDLSATLLASVLGATEVIIWKMLPGLYTADPEFVKAPKLIRTLTFDEAEELGRRGARVLFPAFAHPLRSGTTSLRIGTPFSKTFRHTVLQQELPDAGRPTKPLALAIEQRLVPVTIEASKEPAGRLRQSQTQHISNLHAMGILSWTTASESNILIRKEDRRAAIAELQAGDFHFSEGPPVSAVSLLLRKNGSDTTEFVSGMGRSLRSFRLYGILPVENSLVAIVQDSEGIPALRKLHRDVFGR